MLKELYNELNVYCIGKCGGGGGVEKEMCLSVCLCGAAILIVCTTSVCALNLWPCPGIHSIFCEFNSQGRDGPPVCESAVTLKDILLTFRVSS